MPRYFFSIEDGVDVPDFGGTELPDLHAAQVEAVRMIAEFMKTTDNFWDGGPCRMMVADEWGITLFVLQFSVERPRADAASPVWLDA